MSVSSAVGKQWQGLELLPAGAPPDTLTETGRGGVVARLRRGLRPGAPGRPVVLALLMFAAAWAAIAIIAASVHGSAEVDLGGMTDLLTALAALLAVIFGVLDILQWRLSQARPSEPWLGVALVLYGALFLYVGQLYPVGHEHPAVLGFVAPATLLLLFAGFIPALTGQLARRPLWSAGTWARLVVLLAALTAALQFSPSIARALALAAETRPALAHQALGQLLLALVWVGASALCLWVAVTRTRRPGHTAVGIVALGLAQGRAALAVAHHANGALVLGSHVLQLVGFAVAVAVVAGDFGRQMASQETQLLDSLVLAGSDRARREARRTLQSSHAHDVRSALFAIDGAAQTLAARYETLAPADRAALTAMLGSGVAKLRDLVDVHEDDIEPFDVADLVRSVIRAEKKVGVTISSDVAPGLRAVGRVTDVAGVLHSFIDVVQGATDGATLVIRAEPQADLAMFVVGPAGATDPLPASPITGDTVQGEPVELYVAARLVADQGGDVWSAQDRDGRIQLVVRLPLASGSEG